MIQSIPPQGEYFAGRPWLSLGTFSSTSGTITVTLGGTDGAVLADALRVEAIPKTTLESIYLAGNPLDDVARDGLVARLGDHSVGVFTSPNASRPELAPLPPVNNLEASLSFDNDVVVLPRDVLHGATSFIAEFWLKADAAQHSTVISGAQSSSAANEFFYTLLTPTSIRVAYNGQAGLDFTVPSSITSSLADSQWHHHAVVVDDVTNRIDVYIDGQSLGSQAMNVVPLSIAPGGLVLGQEQDRVNGRYSTNQALYGELDEVRIWNGFQEGASTEQIERWLELNLNQTVSTSDPSLRAYYRFNGLGDTQVVDSSIHGRTGFKGDTLGGALDSRPGPTRADSAPITATQEIDLSLKDSAQVDADGHSVTYTATSDDPLVQVSISGNVLQLSYPVDRVGTTRIGVTATDEFGRQDRTAFDLNLSRLGSEVDAATASILTFDGPFAVNGSIDQEYGDRITASIDGAYGYGGGVNGPRTPNVEVAYSSTTLFYPFGFSGLNNVAFAAGGPGEVTLQADAGYSVSLFGFDMGGSEANSATPLVEVIDQDGTILFSESNIALPDTSPAREFDFAEPLVGETLIIRFARHLPGSNPIGIDNIEFAQETIQVEHRPLYGSVFQDIDGNGVSDPSESPVTGVAVEIFDGNGTPVLCSITDADGNYRLPVDLALERYSIRVTPPPGWETSGPESLTFASGELFDFTYEFDVDPIDVATIDLDNNGAPDFTQVGQPTVADGVATVSTNQRYGDNTNLDEAWDILAPTVETGFIVDVRVKVLSDTGSQGAISLSASPEGTIGNALISIGANDLSYRNLDGSYTTLSTANNTADFHDFRMIQHPGEENAYYVYRDGILVNPGGIPLPSAIDFQVAPRLVFGDGGSAWSGTTEIDSIRFGIPNRTFDFGLTKPIDLGSDRAVVEGTLQTFSVTSSLALVDHSWEVTDEQGAVVAHGADSTFEFPADDDGIFAVTVYAV
ncbi:MAG: LamG-like jellyroll fold domain-containing protein, partial [Planctomycetota bacterium]